MSYRKKHINPKIRNMRPKKRFFMMPVFWIAALAVVILATAGYFFLFFPKFQVERIEISGNNAIDGGALQKLGWDYVNKNLFSGIWSKSIFTANASGMQAGILDAFPSIRQVSVQKNFPSGISLNVQERTAAAIFCEEARCFLIDDTGVIFEPAGADNHGLFIMRQKSPVVDVVLGLQAVSKKTMADIQKVTTSLQNNFQLGVKEVSVSNPLVFKTSEGWGMYVDPDGDIDAQITKMEVLLKTEIPPEARKNLTYLYLQYKDRAYYK